MRGHRLAGLLTVVALLPGLRAEAADKHWDWSGFYLGAHFGASSTQTEFPDPSGPSIVGGEVFSPGFIAGGQVGYNWLLAPQWLTGLEADVTVFSAQGSGTCLQSSATIISSNCKVMPRQAATFTGRLGYLTEPEGRTLLYGRGGVAWMRADVSISPNSGYSSLPEPGPPENSTVNAWGWLLGAGVEHGLTPRWSVSAEYDFMRFTGIDMPTPQTIDVSEAGALTNVPAGTSSLTINQHLVKVGLVYHLDADSRSAANGADDPAPAGPPWSPGWEFDLGTRYWFSSGSFSNSNGSPNTLVSRLSYVNMIGHSGELFARLDSPSNLFVKGIAGGGFIASGKLYDEDWGDAASHNPPPFLSYSDTQSDLTGSFNYFTGDLGYDILRGHDHKVGIFVGYNRYQVVMSGKGCEQLANPSSGVCVPETPTNVNSLSELDTWQSLRVGTSVVTDLWGRFSIAGDFAYLPYVLYNGLDIHHLRQPVVYFPVDGTGQGVQAELILGYRATEALSLGIGARYWAMWTTNALQTDSPSNFFTSATDRYGVLLQASYKFY